MIKNNIKAIIFLIAIILLILSVQPVYSEELSIKEQAKLCLDDSRLTLNEFIQTNMSYQRINDSLIKAQNLYEAQILLEQDGKKVDYSLIIPYCEDVTNIREIAFEAMDGYSSLKRFYNVSITSDMNSSSVDVILAEIEEEINSERYEKVPPLIDSAYEEIAHVRSSYTTLNLFYDSTTRGIKRFFRENGIPLLISFFVLFFVFLIFRKKIRKRLIKDKLSNLELRRKKLQELIGKVQKDYFQYGNVSEGNYNLRTRKFAELVRDIDRQIPLLKEELIKLEKHKKKR